ncbi:MAG: FxLYD domain-containing protein [Gemmatimonadaceae bacterium]
MNPCVKFLAGLACVSAVVATPVRAQQDACVIDQNAPQFVGRAFFAVQKGIATLNNNGDPATDARTAVRLLTDPTAPDRTRNRAGQVFTLGQALALLLTESSAPVTGTRADFGFATDREQAADLYVLADSIFSEVERLAPQCATQVSTWRQGPPWVGTMNKALAALSEGRLDTAAALARRALILDRNAPYAYVVLGGISRQRLADAPAADKARLYAEARDHLAKALEIAQNDTQYVDVVRSSHYELGELVSASIADAPPAERPARVREAAEHFNRYAAIAESDLQRADALQKIGAAFEAVNDTVSIRAVYGGVSSNPGAYGERSLLTAGILATRFGTPLEAGAFYDAVLAANPYHRDALRNLSLTLIRLNDYTGLLPITTRLTALDPNNPENWIFHAYAFAGMSERASSAAQRRAYTDSSTKYDRLASEMPVRVSFTEFTPMEAEARVRGTIENLGTTPQTYNLIVEMLDRAGNVLATEQVQVGPVAAKESGEFTVTGKATGIAAFRYRPLL